jgi:hypothetical protein
MGLPAGVDAIVFEDLKREYDQGRVAVFAGAGVSAAAGLPTWKGLAERLVERMRQMGKPQASVDEAADFVQRGLLVEAMSAARLSLGREFDRELRRHLDDDGRGVPEAAAALAALAPKLAGVITTNLDRLLERAFGGQWPPILDPVQDLLQRPRYIFKPHGTIDNADTWVFTRDEYDLAMFGSQRLQDLFSALYRARTLLFVGASLADDDFGLTLSRVRALAGRNAPTHYAILPAPVGPVRREQLERAGLRLLVYENRSGSHREVVEILSALAGVPVKNSPAVSPPPSHAPAVSSPTPAAALPAMVTPASTATKAPATAGPVDIFISASSRDAVWRDRLAQQFVAYERTKVVRIAHEGLVRAGEDRARALRAFLDRARIVLLLLTADYLASNEQEQERQAALQRADADGVAVIPVYLRPCTWKPLFGGRDIKPVPEKAITTFGNAEEALSLVVEAVEAFLPKAGGG